MRISTSKSEAMVRSWKWVELPSAPLVRDELLESRTSSLLGSSSRVMGEWSKRLTGSLVFYLFGVEKRAKRKSEADNLHVLPLTVTVTSCG